MNETGGPLESGAKEGDSPVRESRVARPCPWVPRDRRNPAGIRQHHLARLNTTVWPIVYQYREGKVKSTLDKGVK